MNNSSTARCLSLLLLLLGAVVSASPEIALAWTRPITDSFCPDGYPIKGNFTTYNDEPCIYHVPGGYFYPKTKPERCYETEQDAESDGCRRSRR